MMPDNSPNTATSLAEALARPELLELQPYQSARRIGGQGDIWINANESPYNNSQIEAINRYPECQPGELISAYADYCGLGAGNLICCRGADEAIELLIRTFCVPAKDSIAIFGPTYGMYAISARTFNVDVTSLRLNDDYQVADDYPSRVEGAKLVFICNPNNPTGTVINRNRLETIIATLSSQIVVIDEAYIEFCPELTMAYLVDTYPNLVVLRTLSKAFALAGARCGFMLACQPIIDMVMRVIAPYPVPQPVSMLAIDALTPDGISRMRKQVSRLKRQGDRLAGALEQYGADILPAHGNYLLARFGDVQAIRRMLERAGVVARCYEDPLLSDCIRFSFASAQDTDILVELFDNNN